MCLLITACSFIIVLQDVNEIIHVKRPPYRLRDTRGLSSQTLGGMVYYGVVDDDGEFVPLHDMVYKSPHWFMSAGEGYNLSDENEYWRHNVANGIGPRGLEYRSGRLIPVRFLCVAAVPEVGERIRDFADFRWGPDEVGIYNLPGYWATRSNPDVVIPRWKLITRKDKREPWPKSSRFEHGMSAALGNHVFVQDLTPRIHHKWGDKVYVGNLDTFGRFIPDPLVPPQEPEKFAGIVPNSRPLMLGPDGRREVYEFRAGRLVPGKLTDDDRFVPQVGGLIIHIRDYVYTPEARPIYNLPGRFYPKGMKINVAGREVPVEKLGNRWDLYPP